MKSSSYMRKIDPTRGEHLGDGTINDADRIEIGPTLLAYREWEQAGLQLPNLDKMRTYRWERMIRHLVDRDYAGVLMFDPMNIRYMTDTTNMQLWNTHNPFRAALLCADGYLVVWEYKNLDFLTSFSRHVDECRDGAAFFYFTAGDAEEEMAEAFARQVDDLVRQHAGTNRRLAVDKILVSGLRALEAAGIEVMNGEEVCEKCRSIKGADEILAMRCASHACEQAMYAMQEATRPGLSEDEIWAVLHAENIKRGGEWIETRLLTTGPRTNPWFQECGPRRLQNNEILAFDTDLVGSYGICVDISRTWWIGDRKPRPDMIYAMQHGHEHIMTNMELLRPGVHFDELTHKSHRLDDIYQKQKYGVIMHGVGLCDEWPGIRYPSGFIKGAYDYHVEEGMVFCVEALVSPENGDFSIKLEDQVLITENGYENLTRYPYDPALMGEC